MNELGSLTLVLSGAVVIFALVFSILGMSVRTLRGIFRSAILEALDNQKNRRGPAGLDRRYSGIVIAGITKAQTFVIRSLGLGSKATALGLARQALYVNAGFVATALFILMAQMIVNDLTNRYVVNSSSSDLPFFFRMTGTWAGSSGSLLFWYMLLAVFSAVVVYQTRQKLFNRQPVLFFALATLELLFVMLALLFKDAQPFRSFPAPMESGRGLNPLLLHWAMIVHPPILYVGYVSFAIPFALMFSGIISGNMREDFFPLLRRWAVFSWFFLGTGILLGSKWAYEELGWGGYWAWDPVENASLMPFLLATAFLHSLIVQERRGMLRFWNAFLIALTYHFCLLGTWITRSGVLQGPHTFAESTIGTPMIIYIGGSFFFYIRYLYIRRKGLRPRERMEAVTSKEGSMLLNNFLMTLATFVVLVGVFSPLLPIDCSFAGGALECHKSEWKLNTFNKIMVPVGIITLFLMGASPLLSWRKSADQVYGKTLRIPIFAGILATIAAGALYGFAFTRTTGVDDSSWGPAVIAEGFSVLTVGIGVFVLTGLFQEFYRGVKSRRLRFGENVLLALSRLVLRNKRRYAGYMVHIAIVFLFIGYAGGSFKKTARYDFHYYKVAALPGSEEIEYQSQDRAYLENYEIQAQQLFLRPVFQPNADKSKPTQFTISQEAHFYVRRGNSPPAKPVERKAGESAWQAANHPLPREERLLRLLTGFVIDGRMKTERHFHPQINPSTGDVQRSGDGVAGRTPTSKPDIRSTWNEDLYIQLGAIMDPAKGTNPDLNHRFEFYYYETEKHPDAYVRVFPSAIVATLEVWINPLVKFIWFGSLLFFISGLIIVLPFGERENE